MLTPTLTLPLPLPLTPTPNYRCITHAEKAVVVDRLLLQQQLIEGEERRAAKRTASESKVSYPLPLPLTSNPQP